MVERPPYALVWLSGTNCDGCTIKALGDAWGGGLEALLTGGIEGLPPVRLVHPVLSPECGDAFVEQLRRAARGELGPYGLINEGAVPAEPADGFYSGLGEEDGTPVSMGTWIERLAPGADFVVAWGDCAAWGGPHSLGGNPTGATGTEMHLGTDYESRLGLPVIHCPGCAPPPILLRTVVGILKWRQGDGPEPELDDANRPRGPYQEVWRGALVSWQD